MNTNLLRLARDAGLYTTINGRVYPISMSAEESIIAYNLFASMIVDECAYVADTLNEAYDASSTTGKFIKAHFGVE